MNPLNAPSPSSSPSPSPPDTGSAEFLGLNLDAFRELVAFAGVAEGFTLAIAEVNFASDGDLLVQALQAHEIGQEIQFVTLDFGEQDSFSLLDELKAALANIALDPQRNPVLLVRGLATAIGVKGDYTNFLNDLNYRRDQLASQLPYPMVLFLPDYAVTRLGKYAHDLWTWKSGLFHFRTTRQVMETAQNQLRQPTAQPADSRPAKQARIEQLERLLSEADNDNNLKACIPMALELGDAYRSLSDYEQARQYYHKALEQAEVEKETASKAYAIYGLGQIHRLRSDSTKAMARFDQAIELFRATGDRLGEANTLKAIGDVLQFLDRRNEALKHYDQAIELFRATGARLGEANTLKAIGDVLQFLDRRNEALKHYDQAIELFRATGDRLG
ncbi:MAG: tetratricopeptide repeat protein, partial [Cyanobacteria bacterium P01_G01_bin.38]